MSEPKVRRYDCERGTDFYDRNQRDPLLSVTLGDCEHSLTRAQWRTVQARVRERLGDKIVATRWEVRNASDETMVSSPTRVDALTMLRAYWRSASSGPCRLVKVTVRRVVNQ